jgi:peroxiredoxin
LIPGSPAAKAGVLGGDVIVRLDNDAVEQPSDVVQWVSRRPSGTRVGLMIKRRKADRLIGVRLGAYPEGDELVRMAFIDRPAPAFELLKTAQGNITPTLAAQRGKVLVVEFWAPWCVACRALIPHMNQWHAQYAARGLRVLGITNERVARASMVARQLGMDFPVLADETGKTTRAYHARAVPMVLIIDRSGTVRDIMVGYDSKKLLQLDSLVRQLIEN